MTGTIHCCGLLHTMNQAQIYQHNEPFSLESGAVLPRLEIAYCTYGHLNEAKDNAIWICHALTANADVQAWWPGMVGEGCAFDTSKYFIVCANILGSCYGTSGPLSHDPQTNEPYYSSFPSITIRDMAAVHERLRLYLGIEKIAILVGGSMGGYQALEWSRRQPSLFRKLCLIATSARESAWGIAVHSAQRLAIEADATWKEAARDAGQKGLKAARGIGMIMYRSYETYRHTQQDTDNDKLDGYKASSYINYQGEKLVARFNTYSYWLLTKAMDSHNIARCSGKTVEEVLQSITQPALLLGINSDVLCPPQEQHFLAQHLGRARLVMIDSLYGHDGFLIEKEEISKYISKFLEESPEVRKTERRETAS